MRFIVFGTGAVGGVVGGRLQESGQEVVFIARNAQYDALRTHGLRIDSPNGSVTLDVNAVRSPAEIDFRPDDVVLLTVKSQHSFDALNELARYAPPSVSIVCIQNGVDNERMALRLFRNVYGAVTMCPAMFVSPGVVQANSAPVTAIIDVGPYPGGDAKSAEAIAEAFRKATIDSQAVPAIARWKYAKLIHSLRNAIEIVCDRDARQGPLNDRAVAEGQACLQAAGIDFASNAEDKARRGSILKPQQVGDVTRETSTLQSITRETGSIEVDYLNGEIVLLGRLYGIATPVNAALQGVANRVAREGQLEKQMTQEEFLTLADSAQY